MLHLRVVEVTDDNRPELDHIMSQVILPSSSRAEAVFSYQPESTPIDLPSTAVLGQWGYLLDNIRAIADITKAIADVCIASRTLLIGR